tara:strand:+ start:289 stop:1254 length:966 start_codon:yes stop_codon:yes gene_type:complete
MAFKMNGWAPKGPLKYKGGGKATNMPTAKSAFLNENNINERSAKDYANSSQSRAWLNDMYGDKSLTRNEDSGSYYENLNDDVNITGMQVEEGQQTLSLDHDDIHNLKIAIQKGGLDKATRDAYMAAINEGPGKPMVVDPKSGELNFQTDTGGIVTRPGSSVAMNNLLTTLDQGRGSQEYPDIDEEQIKKDDRKKFMRDVSREARKIENEGVDSSNRLKYIREEKEEEEPVKIFKPGDKNNKKDLKKTPPSDASITKNINIEGNKGGKTLSQKRAAAVGKEKLDTYAKAWNDNRGNIRSKYKTQAQFEKAAKKWWAKKGLDK